MQYQHSHQQSNQLGSNTESKNFTLDGKSLSDLSVGNTYPIVGMITNILEEDFENSSVIVEINGNIRLRMNISGKDKVNTLKTKAFETAIFVSKLVCKDPYVEAQCQAVFFGTIKQNWT